MSSRMAAVGAPRHDYKAVGCHPKLRHLKNGEIVEVSPYAQRVFEPYIGMVGTLDQIYWFEREQSPFFVYVVQFRITPDAQITMDKLLNKAYGEKMDYILHLARPGQLLLVKGQHMDPADIGATLSQIDYVMPDKAMQPTKRKRESHTRPQVLQWSVADAAMVGSWQLGTLASSAQLTFASGGVAGAAGGPARAAGAATSPEDEVLARKFMKEVDDRLAAVRAKIAADECLQKAAAVLREAEAKTLCETKAKELEDALAAKAATRAAALLRRQTLSEQNKLKNANRKKQEKKDAKDNMRAAADILQNMRRCPDATDNMQAAADILQNMRRCPDVEDSD